MVESRQGLQIKVQVQAMHADTEFDLTDLTRMAQDAMDAAFETAEEQEREMHKPSHGVKLAIVSDMNQVC